MMNRHLDPVVANDIEIPALKYLIVVHFKIKIVKSHRVCLSYLFFKAIYFLKPSHTDLREYCGDSQAFTESCLKNSALARML